MMTVTFDMDGTIYDLYGIPDWLPRLRNELPGAYTEGKPLVDMDELSTICRNLQAVGVKVGIVTWLGKDASKQFEELSTQEKIQWAREYFKVKLDFFYAVPYGTPKHKIAPRAKKMIIVDDSDEVRAAWDTPKQRKSINAKHDILAPLRSLLADALSATV
jgi:hypothetical protein